MPVVSRKGSISIYDFYLKAERGVFKDEIGKGGIVDKKY